MIKIIEIKSPITSPSKIKTMLLDKNATVIGIDHQIDTYFNVHNGRLKLRQGNIENTLIYYEREEKKEGKKSIVKLQKLGNDNDGLLSILTHVNGIKTIVDKQREIFFIDNVKFHIDKVKNLGTFMEIEAIDEQGEYTDIELQSQCDYYIDYFQLDRQLFIDQSYSDMIMNL